MSPTYSFIMRKVPVAAGLAGSSLADGGIVSTDRLVGAPEDACAIGVVGVAACELVEPLLAAGVELELPPTATRPAARRAAAAARDRVARCTGRAGSGMLGTTTS